MKSKEHEYTTEEIIKIAEEFKSSPYALGEKREKTYNRQCNICVPFKLKMALQKRANELGVSLSAYGRWLLLKGLEVEDQS